MQRVWAPWRMAYIDNIPTTDGCFLCEFSDQSICEGNLVVWKSDLVLCVMNRFPYNNGHLLVAPCAHKGEIEDLTPPERTALFDGLVDAKKLLDKVMCPDGFNVGLNIGRAAGAGLADHLHFHIVPRWGGDTNFMPVLADTKVIPQALCDLYAKLVEAWNE